MKKILFFVGLLAAAGCSAQNPVTINVPTNFTKYISVGKYTTAQLPTPHNCPRCVVFNTDSSNFAFSNETAWLYFGAGGGGGSFVTKWGTIIDTITKQTDLINLFNKKVNYSDTSTMLSPYLRSALGVKYADTGAMLNHYVLGVAAVKYTDTGAMLAPYFRSALFTKTGIGLGNLLNSKQVVNIGGMDSMAVYTHLAGFPAASVGPTLAYAIDSNALYFNNRTAYTKISGGGGGGGGGAIDSTLMLSKYQAGLTYVPLSYYTNHAIDSLIGFTPYPATNPNGYITGNQTITFTPSGDIKGAASGSTALNPADTVTGLLTKALPSLAAGNLKYSGTAWLFDNTHYLVGADTASLNARINLKLNLSDTSGMLSTYQRAATAMKYGDTATMLSPYLRSAAAAATYATIANLSLKKDNTDSTNLLTGYTSRGRYRQGLDSLGAVIAAKPTGISRISPVDSLARVAPGLQLSGNNLVGQTADGTHVGFESILHFLTTDSLHNRTLKSKLTVFRIGAGLNAMYTSAAGDSLYGKNWNSGTWWSVTTQSDSSFKGNADSAAVRSYLNGYYLPKTATLTINSVTHNLIDNPSFTVSSGGTTDTAKTDTAGLLSAYLYAKTQHPLRTFNDTSGIGVDPGLRSNGDTLFARSHIYGFGMHYDSLPKYGFLRIDTALITSIARLHQFGDSLGAIIATKTYSADESSLHLTASTFSIKSTWAGQPAITTLGAVGTGTWQATAVAGQYGGTGVANIGKTITVGGNFTTSGAFTTSLTATGNTSVTLPTTGTLATLAGTESFTNKTLISPVLNTTSVVGNIWTATNTVGAGNWAALPAIPLASGVSGVLPVGNGGIGAGTLTGIPKGNGTSAFSVATAGTDYTAGTSGLGTGILKNTTGTGAHTIAVPSDFPTLNQSTTGNAANITGIATLAHGGTSADLSATGGAGNYLKQSSTGASITVGTIPGTDVVGNIAGLATGLSSVPSGIIKGNGSTTLSAATSGTDYAPGTSGLSTGILKSTTGTGAFTIATAPDFPTLNQNTTGNSANITGTITEAQQSLSNNTTGNVSTSKHGYAPILPNNANVWLNGVGTYTAPTAGPNVFTGWQPITSGTSGTISGTNTVFNFSTGQSSYALATPSSPVDGQTFDVYCDIFNGTSIGSFTLTTTAVFFGQSPLVSSNGTQTTTAFTMSNSDHIHGQYFAGGLLGPIWFVNKL